MGAKGVFEVMIFMEKFRNIDMLSQGLYYIQLSCKFNGHSLSPFLVEHTPRRHSQKFLSASVLDQHKAVITRLFLMRYYEEAVQLHESGVFRIEVEPQPGTLEIQANLCCAEIAQDAQVRQLYKKVREGSEHTIFKVIDTASFVVRNPFEGVHQFVPVIFSGVNASVLTCSMHCMLLNYKFNQYPFFFPSLNQLSKIDIDTVYRTLTKFLTLTFNKTRSLLQDVVRISEISEISVPPPLALPICGANSNSSLADNIKSREIDEVTTVIRTEINEIASRICELRHLLSLVLKMFPLGTMQALEITYLENIRRRWNENIFSEWKKKKFCVLSDESLCKTHRAMAKAQRRNQHFQSIEGVSIEDSSIILPSSEIPIIFEEIYSRKVSHLFMHWSPQRFSSYTNAQKTHLFVLVHGFMGCGLDLKLLKDTISTLVPETLFLVSISNENHTAGSIEDMGRRLAKEVLDYISFIIAYDQIKYISFIGFSLGGVIIRAALPYLCELNTKMKMLMTLNSPHLGCVHGGSKIVDAGRWFLQKMKKYESVRQLSLSDHKDFTKTCLNKLSQAIGIEWFRYFILVGSSQDKMVPFESARIECGSSRDALKMAECLLRRLENTRLVRVDTNVGLAERKMDLIGKAGHTQVLDSRPLQQLLVYRYAEAFNND